MIKRIRCGGEDLMAMIDTDACISVASPTLARQMNALVTPWVGPTVRLANGTPVDPEGCTTLAIEDSGRRVDGEFLVMELDHTAEMLLGNNVLRKCSDLTVHYTSTSAAASLGKPPTQETVVASIFCDKASNDDRLTVVSTTTIPARSTAKVTVRTTGKPEYIWLNRQSTS